MAAESPFDHRQFETVFAGYFPWCQPTLPIRVCRRVYLPLQPAILGRTATASPAGSCCCPYADFKSCCVNLRGNMMNCPMTPPAFIKILCPRTSQGTENFQYIHLFGKSFLTRLFCEVLVSAVMRNCSRRYRVWNRGSAFRQVAICFF